MTFEKRLVGYRIVCRDPRKPFTRELQWGSYVEPGQHERLWLDYQSRGVNSWNDSLSFATLFFLRPESDGDFGEPFNTLDELKSFAKKIGGRVVRVFLTTVESSKRKVYTNAEVEQILKNVGANTECGACMCQAYTGSNGYEHTCGKPNVTMTQGR